MDEPEPTQSAELTALEKLLGKSWPDVVAWIQRREAWERDREATEALLLRLCETLAPAAETQEQALWELAHNYETTLPETPATPQPACKHPTRFLLGEYQWCSGCGALRSPLPEALWVMPRQTKPPAPQQTEG